MLFPNSTSNKNDTNFGNFIFIYPEYENYQTIMKQQ